MSQASTISEQKTSFEDVFNRLAKADDQNFLIFFRRIRGMYPEEATQACVQYLGSNDFDAAGRRMSIWLSSGDDYIRVLVDPQLLSLEGACKATSCLVKVDPRIWVKLSNLALYKGSNSTDLLARSLALIEAFDNVPALIPFLRGLTTHAHKGIRSKAVKILSRAISNRIFAERQLQSDDPRIRANAVEGRWGTDPAEAKPIFQRALNDPHHRVVLNGLVGLHIQHDESAFPKMIALAEHEDAYFRSAAAWALGYVHDPKALPVLQTLANDVSLTVRKRAAEGLFRLQLNAAEPASLVQATEPATAPEQSPAEEVTVGTAVEQTVVAAAETEPAPRVEAPLPRFSLL